MTLQKIAINLKKRLPLIIHFLIWGTYFCILWSQAIVIRPDGWYAGDLAHWADGAAHLSYMSTFAYRSKFPLQHPLFINHSFNYSFLTDLIGGLLVKLGIALPLTYSFLGLALTLGIIVLIWLFYHQVFKSKWVATLASNLFLLSGGLGFRYLIKDIRDLGLLETFSALPRKYTQFEDQGLVWLNVIPAEIMPQRAFLLGLIVGLLILLIWHRQFYLSHKPNRLVLIGSGCLLGLLTIIHPHTLIAVLFFALSHWIIAIAKILNQKPSYQLKKLTRHIVNWFYIIIPTLIIGLPLYLTFINSGIDQSFFRSQLGWMASTKHVPWIWFWFNNWGLFFPLSLISITCLKRSIHQTVYTAAIFIFAISNLILFQPYEWDNAKVLTWSHLFFSGFVSLLLIKLWQRKKAALKLITIVIIFFTTFAGLLDAMRMIQFENISILLFSPQEVTLAQQFKQLSHPESVVLTSTIHRNWVPVLTGRQILCGYRGWMWTYGIDDSSRVQDMQSIYHGGELADQLLKRYRIDYVVIGPAERSEFVVNQDYFNQSFPIVLKDQSTNVYQIPL